MLGKELLFFAATVLPLGSSKMAHGTAIPAVQFSLLPSQKDPAKQKNAGGEAQQFLPCASEFALMSSL